MSISVPNQIGEQVEAKDVLVRENILQISLSDGRIISAPLAKITWLQWLHKATPEQQANWSIEPGGFAVYWDDLDDGIEIAHLLTLTTLV